MRPSANGTKLLACPTAPRWSPDGAGLVSLPGTALIPRLPPRLRSGLRQNRDFGSGLRRPLSASTSVDPSASLRSEEHTSELQSRLHLVCRLLLEKKKK